jgi:hypothetical protein
MIPEGVWGKRRQRKILYGRKDLTQTTGEGEFRGQWGEVNVENGNPVKRGREITWGEGIRMGEDVEAEGEKRLRK